MTREHFLKGWSLAVGAMDSLTGLWLVLFPASLLELLQVPPVSPDALVFVSWIGVFVLAVGLSYGLALLPRRARGETVWIFTAGVRALVAVFLTASILSESLPMVWAVVGVADGVVALVQIAILRAGWWRDLHHRGP
ncbi:MAG: hypothetical protein WCJ14_01455 [Verrucomicrobiota bacterium]